jgi:hypothetical protein
MRGQPFEIRPDNQLPSPSKQQWMESSTWRAKIKSVMDILAPTLLASKIA